MPNQLPLPQGQQTDWPLSSTSSTALSGLNCTSPSLISNSSPYPQQHYHQSYHSHLNGQSPNNNNNNQASPLNAACAINSFQQQQQMCGTSVGNTSGPVSNGSVSNGQMRTSSSPAGMMMISGGTTPSPRATSNSPGYSHGHMSNNVPSPQNFAPLVHTTVTPPSSTYHGHSPINHHSTNENNNKTYDVMNRLKNRIEMYREHHENSLAKEQNFIDQYHHKVKTETTRLVKKQNAANESAAGSGGSRKKNSNIGSGSTGGGGRSRSTSTMNASKRSASCLMVNSNNLNNSISSGAISTIDSSTSSSPISNGPLPKAKVPRMTAKQRKLFKQQQMEGSAITSDSQLLINCSNRTQAINTSSSHQTTSTTNADLLNASSVYKFDPHSPNEIKPPLNFLSNNSGIIILI